MPIEIKIVTNADGAVLEDLLTGVFDDALDPRATREKCEGRRREGAALICSFILQASVDTQ